MMNSGTLPAMAEPLHLPEISPETVFGTNAFYRQKGPLQLLTLEGAVNLGPKPNDASYEAPLFFDVSISQSDGKKTKITVEIPEQAKELLLGQNHMALVDEYKTAKADPSWIWRAAFAVLFDGLTDRYNCKVEFTGWVKAETIPSTAIALGFEITTYQYPPAFGRLWVQSSALEIFARSAPTPAFTSIPSISVHCPVIVGKAELPRKTFGKLQVGDFIVPSSTPIERGSTLLSVSKKKTFTCSIQSSAQGKTIMQIEYLGPDEPEDELYSERQFLEDDEEISQEDGLDETDFDEPELREPHDEIEEDHEEEELQVPFGMEADVEDSEYDNEEDEGEETALDITVQPDEIPVSLSFQLGRIEQTVKEVSELSAGQVLTLDADLESPVSVFANGKRVGQGSLVKVQDKIAIQITNWGV